VRKRRASEWMNDSRGPLISSPWFPP